MMYPSHIQSLQARANARRKPSERLADWMTSRFGTIFFLVINLTFFAIWLIINADVIPGITPFDPYPFVMLTTLVSIEAICLAIIVLISQNRAARVADIREETDLQLDVIAEKEMTKLLALVAYLVQKHGYDVQNDKHLKQMLHDVNISSLEEKLEKQLNDSVGR